jgi:hypothetical protein
VGLRALEDAGVARHGSDCSLDLLADDLADRGGEVDKCSTLLAEESTVFGKCSIVFPLLFGDGRDQLRGGLCWRR